MPSARESILSSAELRAAEDLKLNPRWARSGSIRGERTSKRKGISIEFADFRDYSEGDDVRHLDWNVLARLQTPVMRTYQDEVDLTVHLLVDNSRSMEFGQPTKFDTALKYALFFSLNALIGGDGVRPRWLASPAAPLSVQRGRSSSLRIQDWLTKPPFASLSLSAGISQFVRGRNSPGLVILVSDGMDPEIASALRQFGNSRFELLFLQVLSDEEISPDLEGDLKLIDIEIGTEAEITANRDALAAYQENFRNHNSLIEREVRRLGGRVIQVSTSENPIEVISQKLLRQGWLIR